MKCPNCNNVIDNDSNFCEYCGSAIKSVNDKKEKSTNKIKVFLYIVAVLNILQLITLDLSEDFLVLLAFISFMAGIFVLLGFLIHNKYLQNRNITITSKPNGEKPNTLGRVLGIGVVIIGKWRKYADTYVGYTFFTFILPLFPIGCYRYKIVKTELNSITYNFYGSEEWSKKELFCIYSYFYGSIIWSISSILYMLESIC